MSLDNFLQKLNDNPEQITFHDTMAVIELRYEFTPVAFKNGALMNAPGQNSGSCKLFAFAQLHRLTDEQTLHCFGDYYRQDVLQNPQGNDHLNIRNFMQYGWPGIHFDEMPLTPKRAG